jgi:hypothetical protein
VNHPKKAYGRVMAKYYFLLSMLPSLRLGASYDFSFEDIKFWLKENLSQSDSSKVSDFLLYIDILNIKNFLAKRPIDPKGNFSEKELEEALEVPGYFPDYVYDYLDEYPEKKITYFSKLLNLFFTKQTNPFLKRFFAFERELRVVLTALRAKDLNRDLSIEFQFESPQEPLVAYMLAQKDSSSVEPPSEYEWVKTVYHENKEKPIELQKKLLEARFKWLDEYETNEIFTIEAVLIFLTKFYLVSLYSQMFSEEGNKMMEKVQ